MPLALLEHVNLNITDRESAVAFYVTGLGGVINPVTTNDVQLHVNIGASQFHLLLKSSFADGIRPVTVAQKWAGHMELWSRESLEAVHERLAAAGCASTLEEASPASGGKPHLMCVCPWGNRYLVRIAPAGFDPDAHGKHPGGTGGLIALTRAVQLVRPGAAARLQAFWSTALGANCELVVRPQPSGTVDAHCIVRFNSGQQLIFDEREDAPPADAYDREEESAYHIAVYCDHMDAFMNAFSACEAMCALYANPRFAKAPPEFGNACEWKEVRSCGQFRIKNLGARGGSAPVTVDVSDASAATSSIASSDASAGGDSGAAALVLEVEVRSVMHKSCPLTRADVVAGGGTVAVPAVFANMSPLKPPPHAKPGVIRIPHGRGGFGAAAKELAAAGKERQGRN